MNAIRAVDRLPLIVAILDNSMPKRGRIQGRTVATRTSRCDQTNSLESTT